MAEPYEQKPESSRIREKYDVKVYKLLRIPGTFTRENPSNLFADLFWAGILYMVSLVYSGRELQRLRSSFKITVGGVEARDDYNNITPDVIVKALSTQRGTIQSHVDYANKVICLHPTMQHVSDKNVAHPRSLPNRRSTPIVPLATLQGNIHPHQSRLILLHFPIFRPAS